MTRHDAYCAGLLALGCERLPKHNKYTMFRRRADGQLIDRYFFVGKAGALRTSTRPNAASSHPCSDALKERVLIG